MSFIKRLNKALFNLGKSMAIPPVHRYQPDCRPAVHRSNQSHHHHQVSLKMLNMLALLAGMPAYLPEFTDNETLPKNRNDITVALSNSKFLNSSNNSNNSSTNNNNSNNNMPNINRRTSNSTITTTTIRKHNPVQQLIQSIQCTSISRIPIRFINHPTYAICKYIKIQAINNIPRPRQYQRPHIIHLQIEIHPIATIHCIRCKCLAILHISFKQSITKTYVCSKFIVSYY